MYIQGIKYSCERLTEQQVNKCYMLLECMLPSPSESQLFNVIRQCLKTLVKQQVDHPHHTRLCFGCSAPRNWKQLYVAASGATPSVISRKYDISYCVLIYEILYPELHARAVIYAIVIQMRYNNYI